MPKYQDNTKLKWRKFDYKSIDEVQRDIDQLGVKLPMSEDLSILAEPITVYGREIKNRIAIQPLEGFDCGLDGNPTDLTFRRYRRFSEGGSGIIWFESTSPTHDSQTNPHQAHINKENVEIYKRLLMEIRDYASDGKPPFVICQLTHCGRNARLAVTPGQEHIFTANEYPQFVSYENPFFKKNNFVIMTDQQIDMIQDDYIQAAQLCKEAGFDALDIRACHGYLMSELLGAFTRENSKYGGSFENRTRFLRETLQRELDEVGLPLAIRLNATDLVPYPYGFGMAKDGSMNIDLEEPQKLVRILVDMGVEIINISMGCNHATQIQMPYNNDANHPIEHQLAAMAFYIGLADEIKQAVPDACVMTGTLSWPKQYSANIAAGGIKAGMFDLAGFGRQPFAYPEFANDIIKHGGLKEEKCCKGCNGCVHMMRAETPLGCISQDVEIYGPIYRKGVSKECRDLGWYLHHELFNFEKD